MLLVTQAYDFTAVSLSSLLQKLTAELQSALTIDPQTKMRWWDELSTAKRAGTLGQR